MGEAGGEGWIGGNVLPHNVLGVRWMLVCAQLLLSLATSDQGQGDPCMSESI